ncbi:MAG: class II glutamine amidotransferase [Pseudomonadota bacterium]
MCRFLVYKGREMFMSDLLTRSSRSLIQQSFKAREHAEPLNGDGFGVGWYAPEVDRIPCVFTSVQPAWSNRNLHRLAEKIRSSCFFAHVRAATPGLAVSEANCHPFQYDRFLWMHNGSINGFEKIKRRLRASLSDHVYGIIDGTTDSEHAFAVFLNRVMPRLKDYTLDDLIEAMNFTVLQIESWLQEAGVDVPSRCNFALTDGQSVLATKYVAVRDSDPLTLYVSSGERFELAGGEYRMRPTKCRAHAVIIASEPLTDNRDDWTPAPKNNLVVVTPELQIRYLPVA